MNETTPFPDPARQRREGSRRAGRRVRGAAAAVLLLAALGAAAGALQQPSGRVLLTVDGAIGATNDGDAARFDRAMLEELGWQRIETNLPWTEGPTVFEGVPLQAVLEAVDARGRMLRAVALNDYAVEIPVSNAEDYRVILAMKRDGKRLTVRDKGPLWVVYPQAAQDSLEGELFLNRHIWQLARITVEQ